MKHVFSCVDSYSNVSRVSAVTRGAGGAGAPRVSLSGRLRNHASHVIPFPVL